MGKKKKFIILAVVAVIFIALVIWIAWSNTALELSSYTITSSRLPENFNGYRIAHVSDLHNAQLGENNEKLLAMLRNAQPDMIAITGDLIDAGNTDISVALHFAKEAMDIAPCYYITGNHEAQISDYNHLKSGLLELGVIVLENDKFEIEDDGEKILVIGVQDPSFETNSDDSVSVMQRNLQQLTEEESYTILLSHRPELMKVYADYPVDLVLSGHAHGGQFRLPFLGGM